MFGANGSDVARVEDVRGDRGPRSAIVVGAGVVGLSAAWFLQQRGVEVTVLDHNGVAAGASRGNAGWTAPSLLALHEPAVLRYGLRSPTRPAGPRRDPAVPDREWWSFLAQISANRRWSSWTRAVRRNRALDDECLDAFDMLAANGVDAQTVEAPVIAVFSNHAANSPTRSPGRCSPGAGTSGPRRWWTSALAVVVSGSAPVPAWHCRPMWR